MGEGLNFNFWVSDSSLILCYSCFCTHHSWSPACEGALPVRTGRVSPSRQSPAVLSDRSLAGALASTVLEPSWRRPCQAPLLHSQASGTQKDRDLRFLLCRTFTGSISYPRFRNVSLFPSLGINWREDGYSSQTSFSNGSRLKQFGSRPRCSRIKMSRMSIKTSFLDPTTLSCPRLWGWPPSLRRQTEESVRESEPAQR